LHNVGYMPRVVSGKARSILLEALKGNETRPTSDRVKEAVFSILTTRIAGCSFLDLFSGTGQMGIEALSRGASRAVFIDSSRECTDIISRNLQKTRLQENAQIINMKVLSGIKSLKGKVKIDIIYVDPPYSEAISDFAIIAEAISEADILNFNGTILLEHNSKDLPVEFVINLKLKRSCKYGSVMVSFYEKNII